MARLTTEFMELFLESVPILLSVKRNQQETISLKKISEAKATYYLREFQEYACDRHFDPKYVFQDFKKFFEDWIATDFNCIKQQEKAKL